MAFIVKHLAFIVKNLAFVSSQLFLNSLNFLSDRSVLVIHGGPPGPHMITYANEVTHGGPLRPHGVSLTSGK